ncbi:restriction endonuclease [Faecalibacter sp. LW9]|uniref:restriction endonuclease n=1 Tax=Faecalibacter sp. LW9 TaxID=3103144 RepID=UPI002AFF19E0|nr:restriction endonuclease [Faecalibacter sp. LW9]
MKVTKYNGELVDYSPKALKISLTKSGASKEEVEEVFELMSKDIYDGIGTQDLYNLAFESLKRYRNSYAARYSLKKALRDLGPEGYYFEKYIKRLMESVGFQAVNGQTVQGDAVTHEIDVIAQKDEVLYFCECKFRNDIDAKISVTTPMYFMSRMIDVKNRTFTYFGKTLHPTKGFLVTNAYLTSDSVDWAKHYNIGMISWDYPDQMSLKYLIDNLAIYPVTCLTSLTKEQHKVLMDAGCLLVKDILNQEDYLKSLKLPNHIIDQLVEEANELIAIDTIECVIQ